MIKMSDVLFRWDPAEQVVIDVTEFEVAEGERVFIQGASGSGKTTLLNLLGGVTSPQAGQIRIMDVDITALTNAGRDRFRADHIGVVFQMFNLVPYLSMLENVILPCQFSARRRERTLARAESLDDAASRLLENMDLDVKTLAKRPVSQLSVGQQQRVAAARSLIGEPELVIADEPTSSLDDRATEKFLNLLFTEIERVGATLLFVSHQVRLGTLFDRTFELDEINHAVARA